MRSNESLLFKPGRIGPVEIPNRVVLPSMTTRLADEQGFVTDATVAYFATRARGGCGLLTVEMASPEKAGRHRHRELGLYDDRFLPGLNRLTAAIRAEGARASIQIGHAGGHTRLDISGETPVAPSAVPHYVFERTGATVVPEAMSEARIAEAVAAHAAAAARAQAAGFDCVEVHGAHGYLISQFLCPAENVRSDRYGGSLENRARFAVEVVQAVRKAAPGLGLIFRYDGEDYFPGGLTFAEALELAPMIEAAGADALHISGGHYRSRPNAQIMIPPMAAPEGVFLDYAAAIKQRVSVPVIAVGRLGDPARAMAAVDSGSVDFVALGRPQIADPDWVTKARSGRSVRRCLSCNTCVDGMRAGDRIGCLVNPRAGRELEVPSERASQPRRIAVIGAGAAGLTFAIEAATAGHRVTLLERAPEPGGAFLDAGRAPLFQGVEARPEPLRTYVTEQVRAAREAGIELRLGCDPLRDIALLEPFEIVVVATGARYRLGLGPLARWLLRSGLARRWPLARLFASDRLREAFYRRLRVGTGSRALRLARPGQEVVVIGDARAAGKGREAIADALQAALAICR